MTNDWAVIFDYHSTLLFSQAISINTSSQNNSLREVSTGLINLNNWDILFDESMMTI